MKRTHIWIDADACPRPIKDILYRVVERKNIPLTLVANKPLRVPHSPLINMVLVPAGFDVADNYIVKEMSSGDIVITADIPLAAEVIEKGAHAINPRGELYSAENIRERLSMRDFMAELRSGGVETGGPAEFSKKNHHAFANQLDRLLAQING